MIATQVYVPVTQLQLLVEWLSTPSTLLTVVGPAVLFSLGLLLRPAWRAMSLRLVFLGLCSVPASVLSSVWDDTGLHVMPIAVLPLGWMVVRNQLVMRKNLFPVLLALWVAILLPDTICAHRDFGIQYWSRAWFVGIGGWGLGDGLLVLPVSVTAMLLLGQVALFSSWLNPTKWFSARSVA